RPGGGRDLPGPRLRPGGGPRRARCGRAAGALGGAAAVRDRGDGGPARGAAGRGHQVRPARPARRLPGDLRRAGGGDGPGGRRGPAAPPGPAPGLSPPSYVQVAGPGAGAAVWTVYATSAASPRLGAVPLSLPAARPSPSGFFVVLEGGDGAGKSTQVDLLVRRLRSTGREVVATREPGGTRVGADIRRVL